MNKQPATNKLPCTPEEVAERCSAMATDGDDSLLLRTRYPKLSGLLDSGDTKRLERWRRLMHQAATRVADHALNPAADARTLANMLRQMAAFIEAEADEPRPWTGMQL